MLPVATATEAGTCVGTWRSDSIRGGHEDLDGVRPQVGLTLLGNRGHHALTGQAVADEHDATVSCPGDTPAASRDRSCLELDQRLVRCHKSPAPFSYRPTVLRSARYGLTVHKPCPRLWGD